MISLYKIFESIGVNIKLKNSPRDTGSRKQIRHQIRTVRKYKQGPKNIYKIHRAEDTLLIGPKRKKDDKYK